MKTAALAVLLLLCSLSFAEKKSVFQSVAVKNGEATDFIYNYLDPDGSGKDVWTMVCIQRPCALLHKGDRVTLEMSDKLQRVRVGRFKTEKFQVGTICGAPTGCFSSSVKSMLLVDEDIAQRKKDGRW